MKFLLIVNAAQNDGFKVSFDAASEKETYIAKDLMEKLIEKITKIEVVVKDYE